MASSFNQIGNRLTEVCDTLFQYIPYTKNDNHIHTLLNGYTQYVVSIYVKAKQGLITDNDIITFDRINKIFVMTANLALTAKTQALEIKEREAKVVELKEKISLEKARQKFELHLKLISAIGFKPDKNSVHHAAQQGNKGYLKVFIESGCSLSQVNAEGNTPLACAILSGKKKVAEILKKYHNNQEKFSNFCKETYLHLAIRSHAIEMVKWVLTWSYTDLEFQNSAGQTPLMLAIETNQKEVVEYLLMEKKVSYSWHALLKTALLNASPEMFAYIFQLKTEQLAGAVDLLHLAINHGKIAQTQYLLSRNIQLNRPRGQTLLHLAVAAGQYEMVEWLVNSKKRALIDKSDDLGMTPLALAICKGKVEIAKILFGKGAKLEGLYPFHLCIQNECLDCIDLLIEQGLAVDLEDKEGYTPLESATLQGRTKVVKHFIAKGALNLVKDSKETMHKKNLLHFAVLSKNTEMVDCILLHKPSYKHAKDENNETPLEIAKRLKLAAIIERLSGKQGKSCSCVML